MLSDQNKNTENKLESKLAYLGPKFSYHYLAGLKFTDEVNLVNCNSFSKIFELVSKNQTEYGIIAIENNIAGSLSENLKTLFELEMKVVTEIKLPINHCLVVLKDSQNKDIKTIYSHPKAIQQCQLFISQNNLQTVTTSSTAEAGNIILDLKDKSKAAIANELLAQSLGLKILNSQIQQNENNWTRFLVFGKSSEKINSQNSQKQDWQKAHKTLIKLKLKDPTIDLLNVFKIIKQNKCQLTKIETINLAETNFEYEYYLDLIIPTLANYQSFVDNLNHDYSFDTIGFFDCQE